MASGLLRRVVVRIDYYLSVLSPRDVLQGGLG